MKKILLIFIFLYGGLFAKSPYSLEQITKHLNKMYIKEYKHKRTLKRWEIKKNHNYRDSIGYYIDTRNLKFKNKTYMDIFLNTFDKYSNITGIKTYWAKDGKNINIYLILADDFSKALTQKHIQSLLFGVGKKRNTIDNKTLQNHIEHFKKNNIDSYGAWYSTNKKHITLFGSLYQMNNYNKQYLKNWIEATIFSVFAIRESPLGSDIIKPSIVNNGKMGVDIPLKKLYPIDYYYLKALYSNKVYYGMPLDEAIPIMAKYIHTQLGNR